MYTWKVTLLEKWSYHDKDDVGDECDYIVAAKTGESAVEKAKVVAAKQAFEDEETNRTETLKSASIVGLERLDELDA